MTGLWIERREFHRGAPRLDDLAGDAAFTPDDVALHRIDVAPADWCDAERLWQRFLTGGVRAPAFRLVREGSTLPRSRSTRPASVGSQRIDDLAEPNHVLELYAGGATVVLQALQFSDPVLAELSTNLALDLDQPIQVNAYLSPPSARGLDIHFDFHDVLVVQLAGRKRWRVWDRLPRSARPTKRGPAIAQPSAAELGSRRFDRVIEPGDCVVLPRGFPHAAETIDEESAHLTIGVMTVTWSRLIRDRIDQIASGTPLADAVSLRGDGPGRGRRAAVAALSESLGTQDVRHAVVADVWRRQPQTRLRPRVPATLAVDDRVVVTPGPLLWTDVRTTDGGKRSLELGDRRLRYPRSCAPFVAGILQSTGSFTATQIGGDLDVDSRAVVLQRLAAEGVVTRA